MDNKAKQIINTKILSIPPYISTIWESVSCIHMSNEKLLVSLIDGELISVPNLTPETIDLIFAIHQEVIENYSEKEQQIGKDSSGSAKSIGIMGLAPLGNEMSIELPIKMGLGSMDNISSMLQHNPQQKNMPDLPPDIINKITSVTKMIIPNEGMEFPEAEPHCNCMHCQISRAIHLETTHHIDHPFQDQSEEEVKEDELEFQQWDIEQTDEKLFTVVNRLDNDEKYSVYLGHPVGCTCGKDGCEHIIAVLKS